MYSGPGIYKHHKGGYYRVLGVAEHESAECDGRKIKFVIYHSYSVNHDINRKLDRVDFVARPLDEEDGFDAFNTPMHRGTPMQKERFTRMA